MQDLNELLLTDTCILGFAGFREFGFVRSYTASVERKTLHSGFSRVQARVLLSRYSITE